MEVREQQLIPAKDPKDITLLFEVREIVQELYQSQKIFGLSLQTLELTRRFNNAFPFSISMENIVDTDFDQLMVIAKHLDRNLCSEL